MRKHFAAAWLLLALAFFLPGAAHAVGCGTGTGTCFALTGNTNVGTSWSDTDGGANCNATCPSGPAAGDACILTSNSGALTINAALNCGTFNAAAITGTSAYASTLTHNTGAGNTLTVNSNDAAAPAGGVTFSLSAGMTYTGISNNAIVTLTATSGTSTITTNGKATLCSLTLNGAGGTFSLGDAITGRADCAITLTTGTFITNNFNVTWGGFVSSVANTRTLTLGSSTLTCTATSSTCINILATSLTCTANTSTIQAVAVATATRSLLLSTATCYNNIVVANAALSPYEISISGSPTIANLTFTNVQRVGFGTGTFTISGALTYTRTSADQGMMYGTGGTTISVANAQTLNWISMNHIIKAGLGSITCTDCFNAGGNTNVSIAVPTGGGGAGRSGIIGVGM